MLRFLGALLLLPAAVLGAEKEHWLHVSIDGQGEDPERVRLNLPLRLVQSLEPLWESQASSEPFTVNGKQLRGEEIREILKSVKESKDGEFISVIDGDEEVHAAKVKDRLVLRVLEERRERAGKKQKETSVEIRIPIAVAEALFSKGEELNVSAALQELGRFGSEDFLIVDDEGDRVRIWVDQRNSSD
jgi:hypothetical protein